MHLTFAQLLKQSIPCHYVFIILQAIITLFIWQQLGILYQCAHLYGSICNQPIRMGYSFSQQQTCDKIMYMISYFDVIGLGVSTIDILTTLEEFPQENEVFQASELSLQGGGPVATALITLARLGAHTAMLDTLGDDWRGNIIRSEFQHEGVTIDYLKTWKNHTSSTACVIVNKSCGSRTIIYSPGSVPEYAIADIPQQIFSQAKFLHINGRHWTACMEAIKMAHQAGTRISFDGGAGRYQAKHHQIIPLTDICIMALDFAQKYSGIMDIEGAAHEFLNEGPGLVVITDGEQGSWVFSSSGESFHQPIYTMQQIIDTTGCGDSYHGAFLFGLCNDYDLKETVKLASAVAAMNTQALGGRAAIPNLTQVQAFMAQREY